MAAMRRPYNTLIWLAGQIYPVNRFMSTLMFVNGLDKFNFCCIAPDNSQWGRFMCMYSIGTTIQQYAFHQKCGFNSHADAINWYFNRFPNGSVLDHLAFLEMQHKLLTLKIPNAQANVFDPTYMVVRQKPTPVKKTRDGQIISDFE